MTPSGERAIMELFDEPPMAGYYQVNIRRELATTKPSAELVDGKVYWFNPGWQIDTGSLYIGEWAMIPHFTGDYPIEGPGWIASGDLGPTDA